MPSVFTSPSSLRLLTPLHVALGDHGDEGALCPPAAFEQPVGQVAATPELGHRQATVPARVSKGRSR